jgi:nickel-dependent lactate racemase
MKNYTFAYGSGRVTIPLDENQVQAELAGNDIPALSDIRAAVRSSLEEPIGREPLRCCIKPGDKVALIISDMSRFWMRQDRVVPHLVDYLLYDCRLPENNLTIVVANGTHPGGDEADLRRLVTDAVYDRIRVVNHNCRAEDLVFLGTTSYGTEVSVNPIAAQADLCLCLGAATYHIMAGFGGGRKSILPGISSEATIRQNHALSLDPSCLRSNPLVGNGRLADNPLNLDMLEAAGMMKNLFMVNLVMNAGEELCAVFSGHYRFSWERACREVERVYRVPVKEKADVIVAGAGGYPRDMSLYQGTKAIDNVESGLKPGGTLILVIEAREGGGPEEYFGWSRNLLDGSIEKRLREAFTVAGYVFFLNCEQAKRYRVMLLSGIDPSKTAPMGIESFSSVPELLAAADLKGKSILVIPNAGSVVPVAE